MEICDIPNTFKNAILQDFSFPKPIIKYIMDNTGHESYAKLYETCKYFFIKSRKVVVILLCLYSADMGYDNPVFSFVIKTGNGMISYRHTHIKNFKLLKKSLWLSNILFCFLPISEVFPKIVECNLLHLVIGIEIGYDEFKLLTKTKNIKQLHLSPNNIFYPQKIRVPLNEILILVPKAQIISIKSVILTNDILNNLLKMNDNVKIDELGLNNINKNCDLDLLNQFLNGDSGGPLIGMYESGEYFQIGVTARGENPRDFGIYTKVSKHCEWITEKTENEIICS